MSFLVAHYHPLLFAVITLCAMAQLGLTAFLISAAESLHSWPSSRYRSLLILFLFDSIWTTVLSSAYLYWILEGAVHLLASIASSVIWLFITAILWGTAAGIFHNARRGDCAGIPVVSRSRCRETLTADALGWTEFGLCLLTLSATLLWMHGHRKSYVSPCTVPSRRRC
ncbi:hypothetical protein OF83DRAFT_1048837 [Amylostereum chailletii]|nr:hypothetical protein OF83DRAFT_1048837 [Amylostereum chailletii]